MGETPADLSSLDVAREFTQHLQFKPLPKPQPAVEELAEIAGRHAEKAAAAMAAFVTEQTELDEDDAEADDAAMALLRTAYTDCRAEAETLHRKLASASPRDADAERALREAIDSLTEDLFVMLVHGAAEHEGREHDLNDPLIKAVEEDEVRHRQYLATAGIDTPEGWAAWEVAHFAGLCLQRIIEHGSIGTLVGDELRASPSDFERMLAIAVEDGMRCANQDECFADPAGFQAKAIKQLSKAIQDRLAHGKFNLLEAVTVSKEADGTVCLQHDKRAAY